MSHTAIITLHGLPVLDAPEGLKTVQYDNEKQLISHLKELQMGYHDKGDGRPKIKKVEKESNGKTRRFIDCYSDHADWHHVALIGFKFKPESGKPFEILKSL